jgi:prepilin-type N-terminal cleavage/methylation domain-containing protein
MQSVSKPRSKAFTLVELLVVIAIITVLIAILLPIALKVRRRAAVLVCPVAFIDQSDNSIHLTDLRFAHNLAVGPTCPPGYGIDCLMWSPSGGRIGYRVSNGSGYEYATMCVLVPSTGKLYQYVALSPFTGSGSLFGGWVDEDHFIEYAYSKSFVRDAESGVVTQTYTRVTDGMSDGPYYWTGLGATKKYIANTRDDRGEGLVRFVRSNLTKGGVIYAPTAYPDGLLRGVPNGCAQVDPYGDWICFDLNQKGVGQPWKTGIRPTGKGNLEVIPHIHTPNWLDDGTILGEGLRVYDKSGKMVRSSWGNINTAYEVSLRRYWHQ